MCWEDVIKNSPEKNLYFRSNVYAPQESPKFLCSRVRTISLTFSISFSLENELVLGHRKMACCIIGPDLLVPRPGVI